VLGYYPKILQGTHDSWSLAALRRHIRTRHPILSPLSGYTSRDNLEQLSSGRLPEEEVRLDFILTQHPNCLLSDRGYLPPVRLRYNRALQRMEFRVPTFFQKCRNWGTEGYPRLLARLLSDSSDRVASRNLSVRKAWRPVPSGSWSFMTRNSRY
jgi:hypothetical protein